MNATKLASTRLSEMPPRTADAVRQAMTDDGYLTTTTYSPFDLMEPETHWLREAYAHTALTQLSH